MITATSRRKTSQILQTEQDVRHRPRSVSHCAPVQNADDNSTDGVIHRYEHTALGYCILNEKSKFVDINHKGLEMLGISQEDLPGKSFSGFIAAKNQESYYLHRNRLLETSQAQTYELRLRRSDATEFWSMVTSSLVVEADGALRYHLVLIDISEHKKIQEEKARITLDSHLQKARKADAVYRLAGGVAHSFNNMLGVISGYTEMALHQAVQDQPLHTDLSKIKHAADRCAELTSQLLSFAGRQSVTPQIIKIDEVITKKIDMIRETMKAPIQLQYHPAKELWPIKIDPGQLEQILHHLLENAGEAIGGAGTITIKAENRLIKTALSDGQPWLPVGEYLQLSISDDGCGIGQPILEHIFEPFFTTKISDAGFGLGLATVHQAVKQNSGHIEVQSTLGQGTIFTIFLPRYRKETRQPSAKRDTVIMPLSQNASRETILLVDDEPIILEMVARLLDHQGYTIVKANNAEEALLLTEEHSGTIDLLLTDVVMPGMNGDDLAQKLLLRYPRLKCLFMSGYAIDVISERGIFREDIHFIQKPFGINDVLSSINKVLAAA